MKPSCFAEKEGKMFVSQEPGLVNELCISQTTKSHLQSMFLFSEEIFKNTSFFIEKSKYTQTRRLLLPTDKIDADQRVIKKREELTPNGTDALILVNSMLKLRISLIKQQCPFIMGFFCPPPPPGVPILQGHLCRQ